MAIKGKVIDAQSQAPLPGVNIVVKGTTNGTATGKNGNYQLSNVGRNDTLVYSYIGYVTQFIPVNGKRVINVSLKTRTIKGQEMVVVGYGVQKKSDLTGSITSIQSKDFNKGVHTSVDQLLQGKVAGARIVENSGEPGSGLSVSIRGASSVNAGTGPLYVIDGMPIDNSSAVSGTGSGFVGSRSGSSPLSSLNPNDIASIEVLKDASATAIYGARGANGVIIITTKHGTKGKMKVDYNASAGFQSPANTMNVLSPQQYKSVKNAIIAEGGGSPADKVGTLSNNGQGTDWQSQIYNNQALIQNQNLSISAGNDKTQYLISLNYTNQDGIIKTSGFKRYGGRVNLTSDLNDKFHVGFNLSATYSKNNFAPVGYGLNEYAGAMYTAINWDPSKPVYDSNGNYYVDPTLSMDNPLAIIHGSNSYKNTYRYFGTAYGTYDILPYLSVKINVGGDVTSQRRDTYINRLTKIGRATGGEATILQGQLSNYLIEGTTTFHKSFGPNDLKVLAGITTQKFLTDRSSESASGFSSDATTTNNIGLGDQLTYGIGSSKYGSRLLSYIGRLNYTFHDKYLLTATFRADGSSKFGSNHKYGYFPSFALGWKLKQEKFLKNVDFISNMKLRASWGQTGNDEIGNFLSMTTFGSGANAIWNNNPTVGLSPTRLPNPNIQWETTNQTDIGLDFGFFNDRLNGSIDYYQKKTFNMLLNLPVPKSSGFGVQTQNIGSIKNSGFELSLTSYNISSRNLQWNTNLNVSTLKNEVTNLGGIPQIISGGAGFTNQIFVTQVGLPLRSYYGYKVIGVWQKGDDFSKTKDNVHPGDLKYLDVNGDGTVNAADRVPLGSSFPKYTFSLDNTFSYKNFSLDVFIEGVQGIKMLNNNLVDTYFPVQFRRNVIAKPYLNRWTPSNPSNKYPSFVTPLDQGQKGVNSYTVEDASYVRLKSVQLSYTVPREALHNVINSLEISLTGENLYTLTNYQGIDPAVNSNGNANARIDYNTYPLPRTFTLGLKLGF